jgi:hypothetical protein
MPAPWILAEGPEQLRLADPIQVLYDLTRAAGPDAGEAADYLRAKLRSDLRNRWAAVRIGNPESSHATEAGLSNQSTGHQ